MESGDRFEGALRSPEWRLRVIAGAFALVAISFIQRPGRIVGDTKADLVIDPGAFLNRALSLWDPNGAWGQVQNQAYGYLWPMGPFFWVGDLIGLPEWVIQRLWWSLILVTAYLGMIVLLHALKVGKPWAQILGGFAFALSPRMLSVIGPTSIEVWPLALAPWVLAPLVLATTTQRNPKYLAALSALAVAMVGGVNAAATFAVIPLGALWILMAPGGPRKRTLIFFWPVFVLMGTLWWLIPLFLLGSVSPPFLDFIESAQTSTFAANITDALRGTTAWVPYVEWASRAGRALISKPIVIINSFVVTGLGLIGITFAPLRLRKFLAISLIIGLVLVTFGNQFSYISDQALTLLDGPLSPLRNNHKFDPIIRVVLVIGLVVLVSSLPNPEGIRFTPRRGFASLAVVAVVGAASPAITGALPNLGTFIEVPGYWYDAADWLNTEAEPGNVLILPGSSFSENLWGNPRDEVFQSLLDRPWSVRNAIPLTPAGTIRTLDSLERAFASGEGSPALEAALARNGIRYLVVRSDLDAKQPAVSSLAVRAALDDMPSLKRVRWFGPKVGLPAYIRDTGGARLFLNYGQGKQLRAIEVFEVRSSRIANSIAPAEVPVVLGDSSAMLDPNLADLEAVILPGEGDFSEFASADVILTDSYRLREAAFGRVIRNRSASMTDSEEYSARRRAHDYSVGNTSLSTRRLIGAKSITASSSMAEATSGNLRASSHPWFAFDSDARTRWVADPAQFGKKAWIEINFEQGTLLDGASIRLSGNQPDRTVRIETDGEVATVKAKAGVRTPLNLDGVATQSLRITAATSEFFPLSVTDIDIPSVDLSRPLVLPTAQDFPGKLLGVSLRAEGPEPACIRVSGVLRCAESGRDLGEDFVSLDRIINLNRAQQLAGSLEARAIPGPPLERALTGEYLITVSSRAINEVSTGALALIDGDQNTGWIANNKDIEPTIFIEFPEPREVSQVTLATDSELAASVPRSGVITFSDGSQQFIEFSRWNQTKLKTTNTSSLRIRITDWFIRKNLDADQEKQDLPVGVSEVLVNSKTPMPGTSVMKDLGCGSGPSVEVNGVRTETRVRTSISMAVASRSLPAEMCGPNQFTFKPGENRVLASASEVMRAQGLFFGDPSLLSNTATTPQFESDGANLSLSSDTEDAALLYLAQNPNPGWASSETPVVVNGWMQGWISEQSEVSAAFDLQEVYRWGLAVGAALLAALIAFALYWRGQPTKALTNRRMNRDAVVLWLPILPLVGLVLAGLPAAGLLGLGGVAGYVKPTWSRGLAGVALIAATAAYVLMPHGSDSGWAGDTAWVHWISSLCVGLVIGAALKGDQSFRRKAGSSITR